MSGRGDYSDKMSDLSLDDADTEALLRGETPGGDRQLTAVAAFVREMRDSASRPAPAPSPALAALLRDGSYVPAPPRRRPVVAGWRRRLAMTGIGFGVAVTGVVSAGAAGLLPAPVERFVGGVVEALTPLELPERELNRETTPASDDRRSGHTAPGTSATTLGQPNDSVTGRVGPGQGSPPQTGPAPGGASTPAGPGSTSSTRAPAPGVSEPGITSPSVPPVGPVPSTSTSLPAPPHLPSPTLPNVSTTLPRVTPPSAAPAPPTTLPGLPW